MGVDKIVKQRYHRQMTMIREVRSELDGASTQHYAHLFDALSDPTRLDVLQHLASGEHRVRDLVAHVGLAQSTVSKHLRFLLECGLVHARPEGRSTWYSLSQPAALSRLVGAAEALLEATGTRAALCSHLQQPLTAADSSREL